jgi:hypothetical protein
MRAIIFIIVLGADCSIGHFASSCLWIALARVTEIGEETLLDFVEATSSYTRVVSAEVVIVAVN